MRAPQAALQAPDHMADRRLDLVGFQTPRFENWIIYKFHVGSFAGRNDGIAVPVHDQWV